MSTDQVGIIKLNNKVNKLNGHTQENLDSLFFETHEISVLLGQTELSLNFSACARSLGDEETTSGQNYKYF